MARVMGVGEGLFVLCFIWALCIFLALVLSRAKGAASYGSFGAVGFAALLTVILVVIPREPQVPGQEEEAVKIYDYTIVYRSCLLAACALFLVIGFVMYVTGHLSEPVHAKPLRKIR